MTVLPPRNGTQPPPSTVQINAHMKDHTSLETLLIQTTNDNTLPAGRELLLDVLPAQENWNSTKNGTHACTKENTRLNQSMNNHITQHTKHL